MRDVETIDSELRLLLAIRHMAREAEGRTPNTARIDALLDERAATAPRKNLAGPFIPAARSACWTMIDGERVPLWSPRSRSPTCRRQPPRRAVCTTPQRLRSCAARWGGDPSLRTGDRRRRRGGSGVGIRRLVRPGASA